MNMKERNKYICSQIRKIIDEEGLTGKLDVFPVENTPISLKSLCGP